MERARQPTTSRAAGRDAATLTLAAAPIGRPEDASPRFAAALAEAPIVAAEDTRRLRRLAAALGVGLTGRVVSYYEDVERARTPELLADLAAGHDVLLVTDAGLPGISDPGYRLVSAAAEAGIRVTVLPGPSAVTAALAVSGLPSDRFCFEGFPPRRAGERARRFAELAAEPRTLIFFESRRRLATTLTGLAQAFGAGRAAVVCRELTKTHEEVRRGTLGELAEWAAAEPLGEITIVVAGAPARRARAGPWRAGMAGAGAGAPGAGMSGAGMSGAGAGMPGAPAAGEAAQAGPGPDAAGSLGAGAPGIAARAAAEVGARERAGTPRKAAIAAVARELGLRKRQVYDAVVRYRPPP